MSNKIATLEIQQAELSQNAIHSTPNARWQRMTFAGVTPGDPPFVTFHATGQTPSGITRHFS